jgi:[glutamine synthetase] adenylyltransferase / [glutamine synthetase]-adenylyl-L-tyrosine phosphorylase
MITDHDEGRSREVPAELHPEAFAAVRFTDPAGAADRINQLGRDPATKELFAQCLPGLLAELAETAHPDQALVNFERYAQSVPDRCEMYRLLRDNPRPVEILMRLFTGSQFLTEILLCNPGYLDRLTQHKRLAELKSVQQLCVEAQAATVGIEDPDEQLHALTRYQRWELLRIGMCDFLGLFDLRRVTVQLSLVADALVRSCLNLAYAHTGAPAHGFAVIAMGKLGGEELNYSSDIDLLFLAESSSPVHWKIGQRLIKGLTEVSAAGFMYRVDMRLRPWGRAGELVSAVDSHLEYLTQHARLWERQALLKARVIAGDEELGKGFLRKAQSLLFGTPVETVRDGVRRMKQQIEEKLQKKGRLWGEVKLGEGSIRDVEFVVQYLQLIHGGEQPAVRSFNTLDALVRLADCGFLHADEYRLLTDGYVFLRTVEHALQLMHNEQTHELPEDETELGLLARRLDFPATEPFLAHYRQHRESVRAVYDRYLGSRDKARAPEAGIESVKLKKHLSRLERDYSESFSDPDIAHHATLAERITDANPVIVEAVPANDEWRVTIVGYDFPGEVSLICGLLLVYGFDIMEGQAFTYEPAALASEPKRGGAQTAWRRHSTRVLRNRPENPRAEQSAPAESGEDLRRKIVDVFTVRKTGEAASAETWQSYATDLKELIGQLQAGRATEAQGALLKRPPRCAPRPIRRRARFIRSRSRLITRPPTSLRCCEFARATRWGFCTR